MSNNSSPTCPRCGASLSAGSVEGLCAKCLGALNFVTSAVPAGEEPVAPAPPLRVEELAPHFPQLEILECLGRGGMGVVYKARQKSLHRLIALKLLAPERAAHAGFAGRFAREAQALAALNHSNIVAVHDFGQAGGFYYLLMEFVDGVRQAMNSKRFTPEQALAIVPPVCEALQYAHEHGIVHRDIKPENLLLDKEGRVKIADFGVAKMLGEEAVAGVADSQPAGTPQYMAPEQKEHQRTDHRADIYSLGVVLYEMLTGERPKDKIEPPSRRVQVDVRIDEIVLRALEKAPELRFQTAVEMRTQLESLGATEREAKPEPPDHRVVEERGVLTAMLPMLSFWLTATYAGNGLFGALAGVAAPGALSNTAQAWIFAAFAALSAMAAVLLRRTAPAEILRRCFLVAAAAAGVEELGIISWAAAAVSIQVTTHGHASFLWKNSFAYLALQGIAGVLMPLGIWCLVRAVKRSTSRVARMAGEPQSLLVPAVVFARFYIGAACASVVEMSHLPERVATHFDFDGRANGWTSRGVDLAFNLLFPLGILAVFWICSQCIRWFPRVSFINIPRRDYWLTPERRPTTAMLVFRWLLWLACILEFFDRALEMEIFAANLTRPPHLPQGRTEIWTIALLVVLIIWLVRFILRLAEADHGQAPRTPRGNR